MLYSEFLNQSDFETVKNYAEVAINRYIVCMSSVGKYVRLLASTPGHFPPFPETACMEMRLARLCDV